MPLNPEYFGNFQAPDIMGGIERGLAMSDKIKERRAKDAEIAKQSKIQNLVSQNTLVDEQGNVSYGPGLAKSLAQAGYNQEALQIQKQNQEMAQSQKKMALDDAKYVVEMSSNLLTRAKQYPGSWGTIRQEMLKLPGANPADFPEVHPGDKWIEQHETALMPMKEKLGLTKLEADIANTKANTWKTQQEAAKIKNESGQGGPGKLTDGQSNAITFGKRAEAANKIMANLSSVYDRSDNSAGLGSILPNVMRSSEAVQQDQAEKNFLTAVLRKESGASISDGELDTASKIYFPRAGDDPQTIANKAAARQQAIEGFKAAAGKAYDSVPLIENEVVAHPLDSQAVEWAKKNSSDPRAKEILRVNGVKL
jgi:hypothetical protein